MEITEKLLIELQNRLKVGSRRGVHLNAITGRSRYKFDITRLSHIEENLPQNFINSLLSELPLKFKISWKDNVPDLNSLFEEDQTQLVRITKSFENLINQTDAIESEKGINTFGFGFPILVRRDQSDNKLTVAPILIWSLRIKRTKEFNTWEILRNEEDPIYINEVLINHLQNDSKIEIKQVSSEHLDDGLIDKDEFLDICVDIIESINSSPSNNLRATFEKKLSSINPISDRKHYEKLPLTSNNSFIDFGGLFSIFEVQKQNIINDYSNLLELKGAEIDLEDMDEHTFQPISSIETDPSQQSILHSLNSSRNILIQGPPGTGKSQSLTAILVNALENHKKTIVVCEKRTALEVLYNSLNEKGLNYQTILIKDIIKDRRSAVESVRERVDNSAYRQYRYLHSKETLDNIIEKSKSLINAINRRHQKLDKKLIGDKNWTNVVGSLLSELKDNSEDYNLELSKGAFNYELSELNNLLELIRQGETLYNDYKTFKELTFLNPSKLVGNNPFIIENMIKNSFLSYKDSFKRIMNETNNYQKEYTIIRQKEILEKVQEISNKVKEYENIFNSIPTYLKDFSNSYVEIRTNGINSEINNIKKLYKDFKSTYDSLANNFSKYKTLYQENRLNELNEKVKVVKKDIDKLSEIFEKYYSNELFYNDEEVNSLMFNFKSIFFKNYHRIKKDRSIASYYIKNIKHSLRKCKDLPQFEFGNSLVENKKNLDLFLKLFEEEIAQFNSKILHELRLLDLDHFVSEDIDNQRFFKELEVFSESSSDMIKVMLSNTIAELQKTRSHLLKINKKILKLIHKSNDLPSIERSNSLGQIKVNLKNYIKSFNYLKEEFKTKVLNEIDEIFLDSFVSQSLGTQRCIQQLKNTTSQSSKLFKLKTDIYKNLKLLEHNLIKKKEEIENIISENKEFSEVNLSNSLESIKISLQNYLKSLEGSNALFTEKINEEIYFLNIVKPIGHRYENETYIKINQLYKELVNSINNDDWTQIKLKIEDVSSLNDSINKLIEINNKYFNNENDIFSREFKWFNYYNSLSKDEKYLIEQLLPKENWRRTFLIFYLNSILVNEADVNLPTNDDDHVELGLSLSELEKEQIKYIREYWFSKQIDATRKFDRNNPNITVENIYNKRASKNHKRLSLREIIKLDMDLFTTFFPIILTTPDAASNLFKGHNKYFDIVMFDEASQLKLEDNLPALLKGKQIVIAGDEHQMPPSNYFSKIFDGTIEDEDEFEDEIDRIKSDASNSLLDCESLLDFASELGFDKRHLDFHYRSRHPYLIDYSNYAFYNQRLRPLPNDFDYVPIKYININGTYSDNSNDAEADAVISIIDNNISRLPNGEYPTVGVATFNINQRNLILGKINERRKFERFREFNDKIVELEENGFFVKNLENIQGDERDVIILSTTYGINKDGKFAQRFGSINHQKGYKLLNVIVTRAKYKIYVCSSIPQEVFLNYREHLITEGSNNRRGALFAYLSYAKAVSEQDDESRLAVLNALAENSSKKTSIDNFNDELESPFEEEVYEALIEHFDESKIIPQVKFAGFRIDLVYDTKKLGLPKIAIECDGAEYHSSQEAYLHDRHRQKILEKHGFVFHRIWSTNWWRNPKRETEKLVDFIRGIENSNPSIFEDKSKTSLAFTDNISLLEREVAKGSPRLGKYLKETVAAVSEKEEFQTELFKKTVELNSKVKVKYLNIDKDLKVQLVEQTTNKIENTNGIQKINIKSPLGAALKGKSVGDTVKIGNLDKYVRILEIIN